jgi:hypothetical protein
MFSPTTAGTKSADNQADPLSSYAYSVLSDIKAPKKATFASQSACTATKKARVYSKPKRFDAEKPL